MSLREMQNITCPKCGAEGECQIWPSINTTLDPEMKEKVRKGEVFLWTCPECGSKTMLDYPTLYHQMEDQVMIYYAPDDPADAVKAMSGGLDGMTGGLLGNMEGFQYHKRVVVTRNDFREKLMILDAGLDDRILELLKLILTTKLENQEPDLVIAEFLFNIVDGERCFSIRTEDDQWFRYDFPQDFYDDIKEDFADVLDEDEPVVVDMDWAMGVIKSSLDHDVGGDSDEN